MALTNRRVGNRTEGKAANKPPLTADMSGADSRQAKTVTRSFLNSLADLPVHDAEELVKEKGFEAMVIEHGHMVCMVLMSDVIQIWKDEGGYAVENVTAGDSTQVVEDV